MFNQYPRVRLALYALSIAASIVALYVQLLDPELGKAVVGTAAILASTAGMTAMSNVK